MIIIIIILEEKDMAVINKFTARIKIIVFTVSLQKFE